ncbi:hypothetical protein Bbelb_237270 [Branchiostoma belcheri]|nr:hypothetical protein Bbelb_237270 [Branchiostoma belcheri]
MLERVHYQDGCLITGALRRTPSSGVLQELEWDSLSTRRQFHSMVLMYKLETKGSHVFNCSYAPPLTSVPYTDVQGQLSALCVTAVEPAASACSVSVSKQKHQSTRRRGPRYENILAARNRMNCTK